MQKRVWLILAKGQALGPNSARLTIGSEALVQCFVPETILEVALKETDTLLKAEGMRRLDVLKCVSFDGGEDEDEEIPKFLKEDIHQARSSGTAITGTFFTSPDSASFEPDDDNAK